MIAIPQRSDFERSWGAKSASAHAEAMRCLRYSSDACPDVSSLSSRETVSPIGVAAIVFICSARSASFCARCWSSVGEFAPLGPFSTLRSCTLSSFFTLDLEVQYISVSAYKATTHRVYLSDFVAASQPHPGLDYGKGRNTLRTFCETSPSVAITRFTWENLEARVGPYLMASYSLVEERVTKWAAVRLRSTSPVSMATLDRSPRSC